jgi:pimeloyl-ACP methyl ester carboxylesterase
MDNRIASVGYHRPANRAYRFVSTLTALLLLAACGTSAEPTPEPPTPPPPTATSAPPLATATSAPTSTAASSETITMGSLELKPCILTYSMKAYCTTYTVYEDRESRSGRTIDLRVAVVPAKLKNQMPDPVIYLAGGPGGAAVDDWPGIGPAFRELNKRHDWLLIDQRGTGGSNRLDYPNVPAEVFKSGIEPEKLEAPLREWYETVIDDLNGDPRFYTTAPAMDDIDEVRAALGYDKVNLYGGSYGATAVQYYLRQHGDTVRTAIMDGGTMVDIPIFELIAPNGQRALDMMFERCEQDAACNAKYPDLRREMHDVYDRLGREPVTMDDFFDPLTRKPVVIRQDTFAEAVRTKLLAAADVATLPRFIHLAYEGNFKDVARLSLRLQEQAVRNASLVMSWSIRCDEAWARSLPEKIEEHGQGTYFLGNSADNAKKNAVACNVIPDGVVPPDDGVRARSDVPVLIMNGDADPQDPPSHVANAQVELPNSLSVVVPGHGHGVIQYGCLPQVAAAFVDAGTAKGLDTACVGDVPLPRFDVSD